MGTQFLQIFVYNTQKGCNPNCQVPNGITELVFHVRKHGEVESYPLHRPGGIENRQTGSCMAFKGNSKQAELWTEKPQVPQGISWHHQKGNFSLSWASYAWRGFNKLGKLNIQMTDIWRNNENYQETLTRIFKNKDIMSTPKTNKLTFCPWGREAGRKELMEILTS